MRSLRLTPILALLLSFATAFGDDKNSSKPAPKPSGKSPPRMKPDAIPGYTVQYIEGFACIISQETLKNNDNAEFKRKPTEVLEHELKTIVGLFPDKALNLLRNVPIWVEWNEDVKMSNGRGGSALAVYYGGHQASMLSSGRNPLKAKCVTILRMVGLTKEHQPNRDSGRCVILHEIAHAIHHQLVGYENPQVKAAYKQAMERKLYDPKMYIATNEAEFFAEATCSFFDQLSYYPHNRVELKKHDPQTYKLMEAVWGKAKSDVASSTGVGNRAQSGSSSDLNIKLDQIQLGKPICGPKVTRDSLAGRVVMILLWNDGSLSSQACFPKVSALDAELRDFGLTTVGIHLTGRQSAKIEETARAKGVTFAITEDRWTQDSLVKESKDFPLALVFDESGQCVFRGSPMAAEDAVRVAVGKAIVASLGTKEIPQALAATVKALQQGKPPSSQFAKLHQLLKSSNPEVSKATQTLMSRLTAAGEKELEAIHAQVKSEPVRAFVRLESLAIRYKDSPVGDKANALSQKLRSDAAVNAELRARPSLTKIKRIDTELGSRPGAFDPSQPKFQRDNAVLLQQLQIAIAQMKKSHANTIATEEAVKIGTKYGVAPS